MYQCKIYQGENKKYFKSIPYSYLNQAFLMRVNYERYFIELLKFLENENKLLLNQFMIKIMSDPCNQTIGKLEEMKQ